MMNEIHICPVLMRTVSIDRDTLICRDAPACGESENCPLITMITQDMEDQAEQ